MRADRGACARNGERALTSIGLTHAGAPARVDVTDRPGRGRDGARTDTPLAGWKVGTAAAGLAGIASFQQSLLPRSRPQQVAITAASIALGYGVGLATNAVANAVDERTGLDALGSRLAVAGAGTLGVVGLTLALRGRPNLALDAARTAVGVTAGGAALGAAIIGEQALVERIDDRVPGGATAAHAAIIGAAALGAGAWLLRAPRLSAVSPEVEAAYNAVVGGPMGSARPAAFDAGHFERLTELRARMTTVSGKLPGTRLPDGTVGTSGFRFLNEVTPRAEIARALGVHVDEVRDPVRVFGGMRHARSNEELAQKVFEEAVERGAFDRSTIMLYLPAGPGHVNPVAVASAEYLLGGDVASIAMQYYNKPSSMSLHRIGDAADLFARVEAKLLAHIDTLPADQRPRLVRYGESLGSAGILRALRDRGGPSSVAAGGDHKLVVVGTPGFARLREEMVGPGWRFDATGSVFEFDDVATLRALGDEQRAGIDTFMLTHFNDSVTKFHPTTFVRRPGWLANADEAMGVPRRMKWMPGVTGVQGVADTINGAKVHPGILERTGHDYRADLAPVLAEILGVRPREDQLARIVHGLNQIELARVHGTLPKPVFPRAAA